MPVERVPFVDLSRQFRNLEEELCSGFREIGRSGQFILGKHVEEFESRVADYCGTRYAISCGNGSDALFLSLKVLGIQPGDEVIAPANSFIATAWVIAAAGATPVLTDVCDDMNIDPDGIRRAITPRTKAIIPVHLTGRPAQMEEICRIARENSLFIVEDAAQAIGASLNGKKVGSFGDLAGFSLHPLKNLGVLGDGGFITTDNASYAEHLRKLRNHGLKTRDLCELWGYNSRLDAIQAMVAVAKLNHLDVWNLRCRDIAHIYREALKNLVQVPTDKPGESCVYHNFVIRTPERDALRTHLAEKGIETNIHYPIPIHLQQAASCLPYAAGSFPTTEEFSRTMLSLPIFPELRDEEVEFVVKNIESYFR